MLRYNFIKNEPNGAGPASFWVFPPRNHFNKKFQNLSKLMMIFLLFWCLLYYNKSGLYFCVLTDFTNLERTMKKIFLWYCLAAAPAWTQELTWDANEESDHVVGYMV